MEQSEFRAVCRRTPRCIGLRELGPCAMMAIATFDQFGNFDAAPAAGCRACLFCYNFAMRFWKFLVLLVAASMWAQTGKPQSATSRTLNDLLAAEWEYSMQQSPELASSLGDRRWNDRWTDLSLEAINQRHQHAEEVLVRLKKINRADLSPADQLNSDLFEKNREEGLERHKFHCYRV